MSKFSFQNANSSGQRTLSLFHATLFYRFLGIYRLYCAGSVKAMKFLYLPLNKKECLSYLRALVFLMLGVSSQTFGLFQFSKDKYIEVKVREWRSEDIVIPMEIQLQSCRSFSVFGCNIGIFRGELSYTLTASNFDLTRYEGSEGQDRLQLEIGKAEFEQGKNSVDLVKNNQISNARPGSYKPVDGKITFTLFKKALEAALPGKYRSNFKLDGVAELLFGLGGRDATTLEFTIEIPERLKISNLKTIEFEDDGGLKTKSGWKSFCVFSQGGSTFQLRAYGQNSTDEFVLKQKMSSDRFAIPYTLTIRSTKDRKETDITPNPANGTVSSYKWKGAKSAECREGDNMELQVTTRNIDGPEGVYSDIVTIVVEPPA